MNRLMSAAVIGEEGDLAEVFAIVRQVAHTRATVLLLGETGTGKEIVARKIHDMSCRRDASFVRVNCAVFQHELLASELFGHERGAFTGAHERRLGRFDLARGGTLFLDEIGELAPEVQAKLLHVLQDQTFERVGGNETLQADVRIIAATNRNLLAEVQKGRFRSDLYYRLNIVNVTLPALCKRLQDIPLLADYYLQFYNQIMGKKVSLSLEAIALMLEYPWPGNVRELKNLVERAVILSEDLKPLTRKQLENLLARHEPLLVEMNVLEEIKEERKQTFRRSLRATSGNVSSAARSLGMPRTTFRRQLRKLGLVS